MSIKIINTVIGLIYLYTSSLSLTQVQNSQM